MGNFYFFNASVFGLGMLCAIDPVVAQAVGAGDHEGVARGVQRAAHTRRTLFSQISGLK